MNPKDSFDDTFMQSCYEDEQADIAIEEMRKQIMEAKIRESRLRSQIANEAYNALCDAVGSNTLMGTIDGSGGHIRLPLEAVNEIVARIESLKTNVLAEGAL